MNIGQAAAATGVSAKMIRHYEEIGLIKPPPRTESGYRSFTKRDLDALRFIRHARGVGFTLDDIRTLLLLWEDQGRSSCDVKKLALVHIASLDQRITDLQIMRANLLDPAERCQGDDRPQCSILDGLRG